MKKKDLAFSLSLCLAVMMVASCNKDVTHDPGGHSKSDSTSTDSTTTPPSKKWIVSTMAGSGVAGYQDGDSTQAEFNYLSSIVEDAQGNLYVADVDNDAIRMITQQKVVSTYLIADPNNYAGTLAGIRSLVINGQGNFLDIEAGRIGYIQAPANSYYLAGNGEVACVDGQGASASFNLTFNMTIDPQNNLYVPDYDSSNHFKIRKVTPGGFVSSMTLQDNMAYLSDMPVNTTLWYDYSITSDSSGNLYVTANGNNMILKVNSQNVVSVLAGSGDIGLADGQGSAAQFNTIMGMATDRSGNIWVCDGDNHAIRKVTPDGTVTTIAGNGSPGFVNGDSTVARFKYPAGIVVDKSGALYVTELGNAAVRKLVYQ